jgi:hypothetical protein
MHPSRSVVSLFACASLPSSPSSFFVLFAFFLRLVRLLSSSCSPSFFVLFAFFLTHSVARPVLAHR